MSTRCFRQVKAESQPHAHGIWIENIAGMLRIAADPSTIDDAQVDRSVTVKEAAHLLGCDEGTVRRLLAAGELSGHRVGLKKRGVRIYLSSVRSYREGNRIDRSKRKDEVDHQTKRKHVRTVTAQHKEAIAGLKALGIILEPR